MVTLTVYNRVLPNYFLKIIQAATPRKILTFNSTPVKIMSSESCIFCKICCKSEPAELFYEDDDMVVFKDIKPASKFHYLAVPKQHIKNAKELTLDDKTLLENLMKNGRKVVEENGGDLSDIRMGFHWPPFNSINHLHLHIISPVSQMGFVQRLIFNPNTWWFATADYTMDQLTNKL